MKYPFDIIKGLSKRQLMKDLKAKGSGKATTFGWRGKAKDWPGASNIIRGMKKKGKPKLTIV
jgi:hypothetical protein|tara:strand:+ start:194 stop:379 length:186 start_codon:yes stop_codon:yes gene_type:complete